MAWDFAAEIHALSNFNADDGSGTGTSGEVLTLHANRWLTDGAKEVINILPRRLKEKCSVQTGLDNSATTLAMEGIGDILHVTRENADSGYYAPCRKIDAQYGDLANDSGNIIHYATATDPVYWIESSSGDAATLFVKPTPTAAQPAKVYHVSFPTVEFDDTAIANFPDEAEYLVVLYASQKALLHQLNVLQTNTDIVTALTATNTELDELQALADLMHAEIVLAKAEAAEMATQTDNSGTINTALAAIASELGKADEVIVLASAEFDKISAILDLGEADSEATINTAMALVKAAVDQAATAGDLFSTMVFENEETFKTTNAQITRVKGALDNAEAVINGDQPSATTDAYGALADEDTEIMQGALAISKTEIERAQAHLSEWTAIGNMVATEVNTSLAEANGVAPDQVLMDILVRFKLDYHKQRLKEMRHSQEYLQGMPI